MDTKIRKLIVKVPADGQIGLPTEVLEALDAQAGEEIVFAIYSDGVMLQLKNSRPIKVAGLDETQDRADPYNVAQYPERYSYYWSLRD